MKKLITLLLSITCIVFTNPIISQNTYDFGFKRDFSVIVRDTNNTIFQKAWLGGINSAQFNEIDLNQDGKIDLVVFDKHGNRVLPFINIGTPNQTSYNYAPEYAKVLPFIDSWVNFKDYNCDGKNDVFTYIPGGIKLLKNTSDTINGLSFQTVTNMINSNQGGGTSNIGVLTEDYPVIEDLDYDGDLDILAFYGLGSYIDYHKNLSMENTGNCNSLAFKRVSTCWGYFSESQSTNEISLNVTICNPLKGIPKHMGSTAEIIDLNNDSLPDMILGDVDYTTLIALYNGGTIDTARIVSLDTLFPTNGNATPVNIPSMPAVFFIDIDNDGLKDLIVSPFDGGLFKSENYKSVWMYKNIGTNHYPIFVLQTEEFLQKEMIDVGSAASPVLFDYNGDGLLDLFVGNMGYRDSTWVYNYDLSSSYLSKISLYKNTGTLNQPEFKLITRDFANLSQYKLKDIHPAFGDLDNDGDFDMLIGQNNGRIWKFQNSSGTNTTMNLTLADTNYQTIKVSRLSKPQLIDLDNDSLIDLIVGENYSEVYDSNMQFVTTRGNLNYYKNTGTKQSPVFNLATNSLGNVDVTDFWMYYYDGNSVPCFFKDSTGKFSLFVGSGDGYIHYYKNINGNLNNPFDLDSSMVFTDPYDSLVYSIMFHLENDSVPVFIDEGFRSAPAVADLNNDGYPDMIVGNFAGGLSFFKGITPPDKTIGINEPVVAAAIDFNIYPNPAHSGFILNTSSQVTAKELILSCFDISGRKIFEKNLANTNRQYIDVSGLKPGIYLINVSDLQHSTINQIQKLIIY